MDLAPTDQFDSAAAPLVPVRHRDDGWTTQRQRDFLEALAACGSVSAAARAVGMSRESAYALRRRADARGFAQAWDGARALAVEHLTEVAWDRALNGEVRPLFYHGERVGETRHYDNRLLLALIAQNRAAAGAALPSDELVAVVASDWQAALDRVERGEALDEPVRDTAEPAGPEGASPNEAAELELGLFEHWWDEAREEWLTNWPAPDGFAGEGFWIDGEGEVTGPYDPGDEAGEDKWGKAPERHYARTLTPEEAEGLERRQAGKDQRRAQRIELYRRAEFGLASAAELGALGMANGMRKWSGARPDG
jgi:hypothetical protein